MNIRENPKVFQQLSSVGMPNKLTLQTYVNERWLDAAEIVFNDNGDSYYKVTTLLYINDYTLDFIDFDGYHSASLNYPVSFFFDRKDSPTWLRFLDDITPSGSSRRFWMGHLGLSKIFSYEQSYILLRDYGLNPIGNLRIKESSHYHSATKEITFSQEDLVSKGCTFLSYAQAEGATVAMATGAGGEAPKLLLNLCDQKVWLDEPPSELRPFSQPYLVKFPRGRQSAIDSDILRAEYHYYHELNSMGFETIQIEKMKLIEGPKYPSLWLPRFDISNNRGKIEKLAVESVYSMLEVSPGSLLDHGLTIRMLIQKIQSSHLVTQKGFQFDVKEFVAEWVKRDLLNIAFGNSDNHGRNTSFLRGAHFIHLAPIYDFAPMKADPDGVYRSTTWTKGLELGGNYNFPAIAASLDDLIPAAHLQRELNELASKLTNLKKRLKNRGVPSSIMNYPTIGFDYLEEKLESWGLKTNN
ncbi:toxin HipA [Shewanella sairae]|uniref:Toxin HipA n=1 Tax=Shewanella sairae TaxID=190310 RepID=A0ABQ4PPK7_9GAMM|nr:HipA domain-containing protein [Shewanella sairae]MCL1132105.1 HipA domain-containing protein [Shewanella sairae]GIU50449.1 toxin HipA [Shewanella sairae]